MAVSLEMSYDEKLSKSATWAEMVQTIEHEKKKYFNPEDIQPTKRVTMFEVFFSFSFAFLFPEIPCICIPCREKELNENWTQL